MSETGAFARGAQNRRDEAALGKGKARVNVVANGASTKPNRLALRQAMHFFSFPSTGDIFFSTFCFVLNHATGEQSANEKLDQFPTRRSVFGLSLAPSRLFFQPSRFSCL